MPDSGTITGTGILIGVIEAEEVKEISLREMVARLIRAGRNRITGTGMTVIRTGMVTGTICLQEEAVMEAVVARIENKLEIIGLQDNKMDPVALQAKCQTQVSLVNKLKDLQPVEATMVEAVEAGVATATAPQVIVILVNGAIVLMSSPSSEITITDPEEEGITMVIMAKAKEVTITNNIMCTIKRLFTL